MESLEDKFPMAFICFEGLDGSGKSSLMKKLGNRLTLMGISWTETREPGGTHIGDEIRNLLLTKRDLPPISRTELLLYEAARAQHVECLIRPALQKGHWVLCDRFTASSIAFQGGGREISIEQVNWLNQFATHGLSPDMNVLLDLSVEKSEQRRALRHQQTGEGPDRMESEERAFHQRVRKSFLDQAAQDSKNWIVLSSEVQSTESLFALLIEEFEKRKLFSLTKQLD